jgi:hypothetical protein
VLNSVSNAYRHRKDDLERTTASVRAMYASAAARPVASGTPSAELFDRASASLRAEFDATHGGFGGAPKFPPTMALEWLLTRWARLGDESALEMVRQTFLMMARGGIHDQIGGGFARYSVDAEWLVPHFEKMLYDNALLIRLGVHLWQATNDIEVRRVTEETIQWVATEMTAPGGGFFASFDADSEGHEGRFYVWTAHEFDDVVGDDSTVLRDYWGVAPEGNFEGATILNIPADPAAIASRHRMRVDDLVARAGAARVKLYARRASRVWPARDEKILASWNGLMIRALAEAARAFDRADVRALAVRTGEFAFSTLVRGGRVLRTARDGEARIPGFLEDYAALGLAALALYELTFDREWLTRASVAGRTIRELFWDPDAEAFFDTAADHETLVVRPRDMADNAIPSGSSLATDLLIRLGTLVGDAEALRMASRTLAVVAEPMARYPLAFGNMLCAADVLVNGATEVALIGVGSSDALHALAAAVGQHYVPGLLVAVGDGANEQGLALLRNRPATNGTATAYVCRGFTCGLPATDPATLAQQLSHSVQSNS